MIVRKFPQELRQDAVLAALSYDPETEPQVCSRAGVSLGDGKKALEDLVALGLIEKVDGDALAVRYRRSDAPHARPKAEEAVLGHLLTCDAIDPAWLDELNGSHFWDSRNREIFEIIRWINDGGLAVSMKLVLEAAHRMGLEARVGGVSYMRALATGQDDVEVALTTVKAAWEMRQARLVAEFWVKARSLKRVFAKEIRKLLRRAAGLDKPVPLPFLRLAELLSGGLWPGVHILAAASGVGKTTMALMIALHAAQEGVPVLYLGLEAKPEELAARLLGLSSGARWADLLQGRDPDALEKAVEEHRELLESLPFHFEVAPPFGWNADELYDRAAAMRAKYPEEESGQRPILIVLDFLQIVAGNPERNEDPRQRIARASYAAAAVARDFNAAIVLISSTARQSYEKFNLVRDEGKYDYEMLGAVEEYLGVGKESGEIEYSADSLMVLVRVSDPGEHTIPEDGATVYLGIAKQRAGKTAWIPFRFDGSRYWEAEDIDPIADLEDSEDVSDDVAGAAADEAAKNEFEDIA